MKHLTETTHHRGIRNGSQSRLELPVEELSQTLKLAEVLLVALVEVAAEDPSVKPEAGRAEPHGQDEAVEVAPQLREGSERERSEHADLCESAWRGA
jgi:hypothetical protein